MLQILRFQHVKIFFSQILLAAPSTRDHGLNDSCNTRRRPEEPGAGALRSRAATRRMASATSIVQRLFSREHSGRTLDVSIHQHYGYRMYCEWTGVFGIRSFERRFRSYETVLAFCTSIASSTLEGVCTCVTDRDEFFDGAPGDPAWVVDMLMLDKLVICRAPLPPLPEGLDGPWCTVRQDRVW
jgi:hypothetical protein